MKILVLEDNYSLSQAIKQSLEYKRYSVDTYYDGEVALSNISNNYNLYILDIEVPSIDGLSVLEFIIKTNPKAKVLMISVHTDISIIKEAYKKGCCDYLKKPFDVDELILKIEKLDESSSNQKIKLSKNCFYNKKESSLYLDNNLVKLTSNEKKFLFLLMENHNKIVSYSQIEDYIYDGEDRYNAIRSMVKRLRRKLPENMIKSSLEEGYYIDNNNL